MKKTHDASVKARSVGGYRKHLRPYAKQVVNKSVRKNVKKGLIPDPQK